jgi:hypothetical protein
MKRVLSSANGVEQILHTDDADGYRGAIELRQDVDVVLREVQRKRELGAESPSGELRAVAEIPMAAYLEACSLGAQDDPAYWRKWMRENSDFVIGKGL